MASTPLPVVDELLAILREVFPLLSLHEPRPLFGGIRVEPWLQYHLSIANSDEANHIAERIGAREDFVFAQLDDLYQRHPATSLSTRDALGELSARIFTFEKFAKHADDPKPKALWWYVMLPVLNESRDVALISAQLNSIEGAEDFWWVARKKDGAWSVESAPAPQF